MEELKTLKDYIAIKEKLKNREAIYEEIVATIPDDLGFKFFSNLFNKGNEVVLISTDVQIAHYLNLFYDTSNLYNKEERIVFYNTAKFLFAKKKDNQWEENENTNPTFDQYSVERFDLYIDRMFEYFNEFQGLIEKKNNSEKIAELLNNPLEAGHIIALAFYMLDKERIERDYINYFCKSLDEYICFISHTEFYVSKTREWLEEIYGLNERPNGFELPRTE